MAKKLGLLGWSVYGAGAPVAFMAGVVDAFGEVTGATEDINNGLERLGEVRGRTKARIVERVEDSREARVVVEEQRKRKAARGAGRKSEPIPIPT